MPVSYNVKPAGQQDGPEGNVTAEDVKAQMFEAGFNPVGVSQDGTKIIFEDQQGRFEKSVPELASKFGHQIIGMQPVQAENQVNPQWRAAIDNLADDDARRMYIEHQIRRETQDPKPNIMGQGRDWFYFNPKNQGWTALTNTPGMDMGDLAEGAQTGIKAVSSAIGSIGGLMAGPAAPVVSPALGGAASGLSSAATRLSSATEPGRQMEQLGYGIEMTGQDPTANMFAGTSIDPSQLDPQAADPEYQQEKREAVLSTIDPAFRAATSAEEQLAGAGKEAAVDVGLGFGAGALSQIPGVRQAITAGPLSAIGKTTAGMGEAGSAGVKNIAKTATQIPLLGETAAYMMPGAGDAALLGTLMRLPRGIVTVPVDLARKYGGSEAVEKYAGKPVAEVVQRLQGGAEQLMKPRGTARATEEVASKIRGITPEAADPTARDVLGNLGEMAAQKMEERAHRKGLDALLAGKGDEALGLAEESLARAGTWGKALPRAGEALGAGLENIGRLGQTIARGAIGATKGSLYGLQGAGAMGQAGFGGLRRGFTLAQPFEPYALLRSALYDRYANQGLPFRRDRDNMIDTILASNY